MEPRRATPREDRWKMQVKAAEPSMPNSPTRLYCMVHPALAGDSSPGADQPFPHARGTPFRPYLHGCGSFTREPQRNWMTLFLIYNPAMHRSIFCIFPQKASRNFVICCVCIRNLRKSIHSSRYKTLGMDVKTNIKMNGNYCFEITII